MNSYRLLGLTLMLAAPAIARAEIRMPHITSHGIETRAVGDGGLAAVRESASKSGPVWIGYAAPVIDQRGKMCCFDSIESIDKDPRCCTTCRLEERQSWGSFSNDDTKTSGEAKVHLEPSGYFVVLLRVDKGRVGKIRAFSDDCALDSGRVPFVWLTGVNASDSLQYLGRFVTGKDAESESDSSDSSDSEEKLSGQALDAIAKHAGPEADRLLERFVARGQPSSIREQASFWIGQSRGRAGYEILKRFVGANGDPDDEFRKKVLFALSQNPTPEATGTMISVARNDAEPQVRGEAIFWLAQKAGDQVSRVISQAIDDDPDTEVKKKAVFALSQLPPDEGVPLLIGLAKKHRNPAVRKEAMFWLGQSGDPRALDFIESVLKS